MNNKGKKSNKLLEVQELGSEIFSSITEFSLDLYGPAPILSLQFKSNVLRSNP
jgi:hypothetical protein